MSDTIPTKGLTCLNCGKDVGQEDVKLFAGVGVCSECHRVAEVIMERGQAELRALTMVMKETIRAALVEGSLHLPRGSAPPTKAEVLSMIITMREAHERRRVHLNAR